MLATANAPIAPDGMVTSHLHDRVREDPGPAAGPDIFTGYLDPDRIPLPERSWVHVCGPVPFLRSVRSGLFARGVDPDRIVYEVFGPDLWARAPEPTPA